MVADPRWLDPEGAQFGRGPFGRSALYRLNKKDATAWNFDQMGVVPFPIG